MSKLISRLVTVGLAGVLMGGCAWMASHGQPQEVVYDQSLGPQTIAFQNAIYQSRGDAVPLRQEELVPVGNAEGFSLYRLKGGGAGTGAQNDVIYIKTANGSFQPMVRIQ